MNIKMLSVINASSFHDGHEPIIFQLFFLFTKYYDVVVYIHTFFYLMNIKMFSAINAINAFNCPQHHYVWH